MSGFGSPHLHATVSNGVKTSICVCARLGTPLLFWNVFCSCEPESVQILLQWDSPRYMQSYTLCGCVLPEGRVEG